MSDVLRFQTARGRNVLVEVPPATAGGFQNSSFKDHVVDAKVKFESALSDVVDAAESALDVIVDGPLRPDTIAMTFGVRFSGELGAMLAKTSVEANLSITLTWGKERESGPEVPDAPIIPSS